MNKSKVIQGMLHIVCIICGTIGALLLFCIVGTTDCMVASDTVVPKAIDNRLLPMTVILILVALVCVLIRQRISEASEIISNMNVKYVGRMKKYVMDNEFYRQSVNNAIGNFAMYNWGNVSRINKVINNVAIIKDDLTIVGKYSDFYIVASIGRNEMQIIHSRDVEENSRGRRSQEYLDNLKK